MQSMLWHILKLVKDKASVSDNISCQRGSCVASNMWGSQSM